MRSSDGLFNSFVHITNDKKAAHTPYAWLQTINYTHLSLYNRRQWKAGLLFTQQVYHSLASAGWLSQLTSSAMFIFHCAFWWTCIHVILLCSLIAAAWFRHQKATVWSPKCYQALSSHAPVRGNSLGTFLVCVCEWWGEQLMESSLQISTMGPFWIDYVFTFELLVSSYSW